MAGLGVLYLPSNGSPQPVLDWMGAFSLTNPRFQPRGATIL